MNALKLIFSLRPRIGTERVNQIMLSVYVLFLHDLKNQGLIEKASKEKREGNRINFTLACKSM